MNAEIKSMIKSWLSLLADFLRFFKWEPYDKIADELDSIVAKEDDAE